MKGSHTAVTPVLILCASLIGFSARAATITVTNNNDTTTTGDGVSLREAILSINAGANTNTDVVAVGAYGASDTINFNIGVGLQTISIGTTALPPITKPVFINGYTETGASANTLASGDNAVITIKLDGTGVTGPIPGEVGLRLDPGSSGSVIRGLDIVSFPGAGIRLFSSNNTVAGCWIGVNTAGVAAGNGTSITLTETPKAGILIGDNGIASTVTASNNTIGGTAPADRNVISANPGNVLIQPRFDGGNTASGNVITGNFIGTNKDGTAILTNTGAGITLLPHANNTVIGGTTGTTPGGACTGACNVISGNSLGVQVSGILNSFGDTAGTIIQGNFIGTDVTGNVGLGNGNAGNVPNIYIVFGAVPVTIGGTSANARNVVSGALNNAAGISIQSGSTTANLTGNFVTIQGNYIGTNTSGTAAIGNTGHGISDDSGTVGTIIGGTAAGAGNVISGNGTGSTSGVSGLLLNGAASTTVQGNFIGVAADGVTAMGNTGAGVDIQPCFCGLNTFRASDNVIGAATTGGAGTNIIANNGTGSTMAFPSGILLGDPLGVNNKFFGNSIYNNGGMSNAGIGIDIAAAGGLGDGVTPNTAACTPAILGGNKRQNYPVLTSAQTTGTQITIAGSLTVATNGTFTVEFFSDTHSTSPKSEAKTFLGSTTVTTAGGGCTNTFTAILSASVAVGLDITATATDSTGNTSELAAAIQAIVALNPPTGTKSFAPSNVAPNATSVLSITLSNSNSTPITGAAFTDNYPSNLVNTATPNGTGCGGTVTAAPNGTGVTLANGIIPANGTCTVTVNVTSSTAGTYNNSIAAGITSTNAGSNPAAINGTLVVNSPPTVSKSFAPPVIAVNGTSTLTITLTNPNAVPLTGAGFTDTYPGGLINATPANGTGCSGTVTATNGGNSVALAGGTIPANGNCTVNVTVTSSAAGSYPNSIGPAAVTTANSGSNTNTGSATLTVSSLAATSLSKSFTPNSISVGGTSTLTLTLTNSNSTAVTGASVTDNYPAGLINATPANGTGCSGTVTATNGGNSVTLTGGTIPANGTCTVTVLVTSASAASYPNTTLGLTSANAPTAPGASATLTVTLAAIPTLSPWALLLLSLILGFVAFAALKRS